MPGVPGLIGSQLRLLLPGRRAGRCAFDRTGRLRGPISVAYNTPWPCASGNYGGSLRQGVVMHTMVGNLPGAIATFNDPAGGIDGPVSAHFGISQAGQVHQFGPVGGGWVAWHVAAGNFDWFGIEHADNGNPDIPLTDAQLTASAQIVEALSTVAGFPLAEANTTAQSGYGVHYMGGPEWGGHTCPDLPPDHVRSRQRPVILARAAAIRAGQPLPPGTGPEGAAGAGRTGEVVAAGHPPLVVVAVVAGLLVGLFALAVVAASAVAAGGVWLAGRAVRS